MMCRLLLKYLAGERRHVALSNWGYVVFWFVKVGLRFVWAFGDFGSAFSSFSMLFFCLPFGVLMDAPSLR